MSLEGTNVIDRMSGADNPLEDTLRISGRIPIEDLTAMAEAGAFTLAIFDAGRGPDSGGRTWSQLIDQMARGLFRRKARHVLVTGQPGVGKTTLVRELARQATAGTIPFLREKRFLRIDCQDLSPNESRRCFETLLAAFSDAEEAVLCLDSLEALLRTDGGPSKKPLLRQAMRHPRLRIIGILSQWDFDELLANDAGLLDLCTVIHVPEPDEDFALAIVREAASRLEADFRLAIPSRAIEDAVRLSAKYIWNQRLPQIAIGILERACEAIDYERTQLGREVQAVSCDDVIRIVAELSRVPVETLAGDIDETDYEEVLRATVVGQEEAVAAVATELRLIRAGITDPSKPASVMMFCGQNGVGKTELAKKLAEIYSASKRLQIYTMGNFVESHAVSGIIGVPAGYVGHDQGGRLINDLNADPYGVFLIDEIEKAHPDVMKPFLNLFDEGWIVDQRGVKAYADRAIFILTSNAGYEAISQMHQDKRPMEEIAEHVKKTLAQVRNERSSQPVLSTAFLSRIKRIIVFNPLSEPALLGITRILVSQMQANWQRHRGKTVVVPDELIAYIARRGHEINESSGGREGGRGIRRLIDDLIEDRIQKAAVHAKRDYVAARRIEFSYEESQPAFDSLSSEAATQPVPPPTITVRFL